MRFGDIAVREAASAIDAGLLLTNHVLGLRFDQGKLHWRRSQASRSLRTQVQQLSAGQGSRLVQAIDSIWDSIGFELLQEYRNWVTHRGAPRVSTSLRFPGPIPIPDEVLKIEDIAQREWELRSYLLTEIPERIQVQCAPFYPPVMLIYSAEVDSLPQDVTLPGGIRIAKGAGRVVIRDARVGSGSLLEHRDSFRQRNQVTPEESRAVVAGEALAVYKALDYVQAVGSVVRFATQALSTSWDQELAALWQQQHGASS